MKNRGAALEHEVTKERTRGIWLLAAIFLPAWPVQTFGVGLVIAAAILSLVGLSRMLIP
jgi:hypothetical protein